VEGWRVWVIRLLVASTVTPLCGLGILKAVDLFHSDRRPTTLKNFIPPDGSVALGAIQFVAQLRGFCYSDFSLQDPDRRVAHLCIPEDRRAIDPCFINYGPVSPQVRCFQSPWSAERMKDGTLVTPAIGFHVLRWVKKGSPGPPAKNPRPWGMELSDGTRCLWGRAPSPSQPPDTAYTCFDKAGLAGWVIGYPDDKTDVWRVNFVEAEHTGEGSKPRDIRVAWQ
jgi:hypothetical protein